VLGVAPPDAASATPAAATPAAATPAAATPAAAACSGGTVYLTLDTGNMSQAENIAATLRRQGVKASFFLANEKTPAGDYSLDDAWAPYWRERVREGHAFGTHTYDHVYFRGVAPDGRVLARPQFGAQAGRTLHWDGPALCSELDRVTRRFRELTGRGLDPVWRAPGGKAPAEAMAAAKACGWSHVHWAPAGFLGDELPSDRFPNDRLLKQALAGIRDGDILMAHLGIWSRKDPYAPMLDPLIAGLKARGMCFATLREHPAHRR
jgi:peptidoglycan/xylan/chitin deacetylase (PgdA/CDA1 family)